MGRDCGCSGSAVGRPARAITPQPNTTTASGNVVDVAGKVFYEIWRNGRFTGRRSESIVSAQATAERMGGEVRPSK